MQPLTLKELMARNPPLTGEEITARRNTALRLLIARWQETHPDSLPNYAEAGDDKWIVDGYFALSIEK